jgi:hypothetical protein
MSRHTAATSRCHVLKFFRQSNGRPLHVANRPTPDLLLTPMKPLPDDGADETNSRRHHSRSACPGQSRHASCRAWKHWTPIKQIAQLLLVNALVAGTLDRLRQQTAALDDNLRDHW